VDDVTAFIRSHRFLEFLIAYFQHYNRHGGFKLSFPSLPGVTSDFFWLESLASFKHSPCPLFEIQRGRQIIIRVARNVLTKMEAQSRASNAKPAAGNFGTSRQQTGITPPLVLLIAT
jgi:hypothetical protein